MKKNKLLGLVLALCLMAGLVIGTAATAYADDTMTITLTIAPSAYTVTLTGGGNATPSGATTQSVTPGQAMTTVTYTANSGYTFPAFSNSTTNGVTLTRVSDTVVTVSGTPTANVNITVPDAAAIPTYTVSFASNGGSGTMDPVSIAAGTIYPLPACTFTPPAGQQFRAWSYNGQEYAVGTQFTINSDATFTAVWEDIPVTTYTVSFTPNGGSGTMAPVSVAAGGIYPLPTCTFTPPAGQQFRAWSYNGQEYAVGTQFTINSDATFIAVWEDIPVTTYTVTVHPGANGAAGVSQNVAAPGTTITVNPVPFSGYEVASITWSSDGGATRNDITDMASFVMPAANVDVYVEFRPAGGGGGGSSSDGGDEWYGGYATQRGYRVRLAPVTNGSAVLAVEGWSTTTEMSVVPTTLVCVYPTPAPGYELASIVWGPEGGAGTDITGNQSFVMPSMDVVVSVTFRPVA